MGRFSPGPLLPTAAQSNSSINDADRSNGIKLYFFFLSECEGVIIFIRFHTLLLTMRMELGLIFEVPLAVISTANVTVN